MLLTIVYKCAQLNDDAGDGENERTKSQSAVERRKHGDKINSSGRSTLRGAHFLHLRPGAHQKHGASDGHDVAESEGNRKLPGNDKKHGNRQKVEKETHGETGRKADQPVGARQ